MIRLGSLERECSLLSGVLTLKSLKIVTRQIWLHNSLGLPQQVNELRTISASIDAAGKCF